MSAAAGVKKTSSHSATGKTWPKTESKGRGVVALTVDLVSAATLGTGKPGFARTLPGRCDCLWAFHITRQ